MTVIWTTPKIDSLEIASDEIHIWCASLNLREPYVQILEKRLSLQEQQRANKFIFEKDKNRFIVGRYVLRMLIGSYLSRPPEHIQLVYGVQGKPVIDPFMNEKKLCFNLAHSSGMAVYIFALNRSLGIDLEYTHKSYKCQPIIERWFTKGEQMIYSQLPENEKQRYFNRAWTLKEAYLKGLGRGLVIPLDDIELIINLEMESVVNYRFKDQQEGSKWDFSPFTLSNNYLGTYAIRNEKVPYQVKWANVTDKSLIV